MKHLTLVLSVVTVCAYAQTPAAKPAAIAPETVVFKVGDRPVTRAEFERLIATFPPEIQKTAKTNPRQVMQSFFLMQSLSKQAESEKLDQMSPFKEQLELQRMQFLATTVLNRESSRIQVSGDDLKARYEADKTEKYEQAKISAIVVMFTDPKAITAQVDMSNGGKKPEVKDVVGVRLEPDAKNIADAIVADLRGGADFAAVARQKSDDKSSAAKGGDFGVIRRVDRVPEDIKKAVFALKPGEISEPVRQPLGFYIVKVESRTVQPFDEVKQLVTDDLKQERFQKWMSGMQSKFEIDVEAPSYFQPAAPSSPPAQSSVPKR